MEHEELERKLQRYISQHCEELNFKFREKGSKVIKIEWNNLPLNLRKIDGVENYNYEFSGNAQIGIEANNGYIMELKKCHGEALINENGNIEINRPIVIEN